jgi:NAD(P)-dependent dehydrogenase (short-subunit alcohol dehydrogenase family)
MWRARRGEAPPAAAPPARRGRYARAVVILLGADGGEEIELRTTDPERMDFNYPVLAYCASKAAVSMLTVQYSKVFPKLRINVVDPGYTATDLNGFTGTQTVEQGVITIVRAALLGDDRPTGTFTGVDGPIPW